MPQRSGYSIAFARGKLAPCFLSPALFFNWGRAKPDPTLDPDSLYSRASQSDTEAQHALRTRAPSSIFLIMPQPACRQTGERKMDRPWYDIVCSALARHLKVAVSRLEATQRLADDWGLRPLDLVTVALELEDVEAIDFPIAGLHTAHTVGDLVLLLSDSPELRRRRLRPVLPPAKLNPIDALRRE
jgi:hypothetical protein